MTDRRTDRIRTTNEDRVSIAASRAKKDSNDRTGKKVTKWLTSLGRSPTEAIYIKNCVVGDGLDVVTCAKFQNEILRGYHFTGV